MKVYFNNSCKICKAEIDLYKKEKIKEIDWVDITNNALAKKEKFKFEAEELTNMAAEPDTAYMSKPKLEQLIRDTRKQMEAAAKELDFMEAAKLRDRIKSYQEQVKELG